MKDRDLCNTEDWVMAAENAALQNRNNFLIF